MIDYDKKIATKILNNKGWDDFIEYLDCINDYTIREYIQLYYNAYLLMIDNDFDSGLCYQIRHAVIQDLIKILEI